MIEIRHRRGEDDDAKYTPAQTTRSRCRCSQEAPRREAAAGRTAERPSPLATAPAPPAESGGMSAEAIERLKELGQLHEQNVLAEFEHEKAKLL